ncbi:MAG: hypothetical protein GF317_11050 [Candidatus Lokiarchaeota archaeon]|nr:hypothetical protein [Candidatus Lokiarchaeota archaeon]MBD3200200.1 hypothetical protein [Candidatus Lokiarchaeota archaeon]
MRRTIDMICDVVFDAGIDHVFGLPGGVADFLFEEFYKRSDQFKTIVTHHEASGAIMADMYGRLTRKPGIVIGQGIFMATNGGLGIAEAYHAGVPMVILTEMSDYHGNSLQGVYQSGTGEYGTIDLISMFKSMTKFTAFANVPEELPYAVQLAIKHATSGRPGPACVLTRWNVMNSVIEEDEMEVPLYSIEGHLRVSPPTISDLDAEKIANVLLAAESPVMICGRGSHASNAYQEVRVLAELIGMPVATSYMGKSIIEETHDLALGVMASFGQEVADQSIQNADVILAVGTCLAPDNTNNCSPEFINVKKQKLIHIDIEPRNAGWTYPVTIGVTADAKSALQKITEKLKSKMSIFPFDAKQRISKLKQLKERDELEFFTAEHYNDTETPIQPESIVKIFNDLMGNEHMLILDAGNNRMWFTKLFQTKYPGQIIGAGGVAAMGWGPNASLAAQLLKPDKKVINIVGDSSFLMDMYTLETVKEYDLPITFFIFNDSSLGNVRDVLSRKGRDLANFPNTNFANIAKSMNIEGLRVEKYQDLKPAIEKGINSKKAMLVDLVIDPKASHLRVRRS